MKKKIVINGMMCEYCAQRIGKALISIDGVDNADVSFQEKTAVIQCDEVSDEMISSIIIDTGYTIESITDI